MDKKQQQQQQQQQPKSAPPPPPKRKYEDINDQTAKVVQKHSAAPPSDARPKSRLIIKRKASQTSQPSQEVVSIPGPISTVSQEDERKQRQFDDELGDVPLNTAYKKRRIVKKPSPQKFTIPQKFSIPEDDVDWDKIDRAADEYMAEKRLRDIDDEKRAQMEERLVSVNKQIDHSPAPQDSAQSVEFGANLVPLKLKKKSVTVTSTPPATPRTPKTPSKTVPEILGSIPSTPPCSQPEYPAPVTQSAGPILLAGFEVIPEPAPFSTTAKATTSEVKDVLQSSLHHLTSEGIKLAALKSGINPDNSVEIPFNEGYIVLEASADMTKVKEHMTAIMSDINVKVLTPEGEKHMEEILGHMSNEDKAVSFERENMKVISSTIEKEEGELIEFSKDLVNTLIEATRLPWVSITAVMNAMIEEGLSDFTKYTTYVENEVFLRPVADFSKTVAHVTLKQAPLAMIHRDSTFWKWWDGLYKRATKINHMKKDLAKSQEQFCKTLRLLMFYRGRYDMLLRRKDAENKAAAEKRMKQTK